MSETMVIWRRTGERQEVEATIFHSSERALVLHRCNPACSSGRFYISLGCSRGEQTRTLTFDCARERRSVPTEVVMRNRRVDEVNWKISNCYSWAGIVVLRCVWQRPLAW